MKRIIPSLVLIAVVIGAITYGATTAFFSDTETSEGNVFTAGALDLQIDNDSYYNGNRCMPSDDEGEEGTWEWSGTADFPEPGTPCTTSWGQDDLTGHLFFDFTDIKPSDEGEDTISIHVQNDAWACMDLTLTSNDDNSLNEPELEDGDTQDVEVNLWDGELAQNLEMFWWGDDGDNVYEEGEETISGGVQTLYNLASTTGPFSIAIADSLTNAWGEDIAPIPGGETVYIAKAWCFGDLIPAAVPDVDPADEEDEQSGPQERGTGGYTCDGSFLDNQAQTDSVLLDVEFRSEQARHNDDFTCELPEDGTITVVKNVVGSNDTPDDFSFVVDGGNAVPFENDGTNVVNTTAGIHDIVEPVAPGYVTTYSSPNGATCENLVVPENGNVTCTITNTFTPNTGTLVVNKVVNGSDADEDEFSYQINGGAAVQFEDDGSNSQVLPAPNNYSVVEVAPVGYSVSYTNSVNGNLNCDNLPLAGNGNVTCTITNTFAPICDAAIDLMIVMDNSSSINDAEENIMQAGAVSFINALDITPALSHTGLASFGTTASLSQSLTGTEATIIAAINAPFGSGNTNLSAGIDVATTELASGNDRPAIPDVMVVITDGNPNVPTNEATAEAAALASANAAKAAGATIYVVGVGSDVNAAYLQTIASPGGYYSADDFEDLEIALLTIANCGEVPTTIYIDKTVVGGTADAEDFTFLIDGNPASLGLNIVTPGLHTVTEQGGPANYTATFGGECNAEGEITAVDGENVTCEVTNTFNPQPPVTLLSDGFGQDSTDTTFDENPDTTGTGPWTEGLNNVVGNGGEKRASGAGNDSASGNGGRFATLFSADGGANDGWICRSVNATGFNSLMLSYFWRGDADADNGNDDGIVEYKLAGNCTDTTGWTNLGNHDLRTDDLWTTRSAFQPPANTDNTSFLIKFRAAAGEDSELFRVDGVVITATPN